MRHQPGPIAWTAEPPQHVPQAGKRGNKAGSASNPNVPVACFAGQRPAHEAGWRDRVPGGPVPRIHFPTPPTDGLAGALSGLFVVVCSRGAKSLRTVADAQVAAAGAVLTCWMRCRSGSARTWHASSRRLHVRNARPSGDVRRVKPCTLSSCSHP